MTLDAARARFRQADAAVHRRAYIGPHYAQACIERRWWRHVLMTYQRAERRAAAA